MALKVVVLIGTRPEAIKLAPIVQYMRRRPAVFSVRVCLTGQHRALVHDVLPAFGITADEDLHSTPPAQTLGASTGRILAGVESNILKHGPDIAMVQGDTSTAFAGALAAFYARVPVAHVEAGLRTGDVSSPFPEEMNRVLISRLASFHFAATATAAENLYAEGVSEKQVWVTGNTGIDAIELLCRRLQSGVTRPALPFVIDPARKLLLVTAHRRENLPDGLHGVTSALQRLAERPDVQIVFPLHPNPEVRRIVEPALASCRRIHMVEALEYSSFMEVMRQAYFILSDSGGIQEEAPALGKPVLVLRDTTERPEGIAAGAARLVGTDPQCIVDEATRLLDVPDAYATMAQPRHIYGDGKASSRICRVIASFARRKRVSDVAGAIAV